MKNTLTIEQMFWKDTDCGEEDLSLKNHNNLTIHSFPQFFQIEGIQSNQENLILGNHNTFQNKSNNEEDYKGLKDKENIISGSNETKKYIIENDKKSDGIKSSMAILNTDNENVSQIQKKENRFFKTILTYFLVQRFIINLKKSMTYRSKPKEIILKAINDKSYYSDGLIQRKMTSYKGILSYLYYSQQIVKFFHGKNIIILPNNSCLIFFDIVLIALCLSYFIIIPFNVALHVNLIELVLKYFQIENFMLFQRIIFAFFIFEILINFNLAYFNEGDIVLERSLIISYYLKHCFIRDLISIVYLFISCFDIEIPFILGLLTALLYILKIDGLKKKIKRLEDIFLHNDYIINLLRFFKLFISFLFFIHVLSCFWIFCGYHSYKNQNKTWLNVDDLINQDLMIQYMCSYYYVMTIVIHLGFSDVIPQSNLEKLYTIIIIMTAIFYFSLNFNSFMKTLKKINKDKIVNQEKLEEATSILNDIKIPFITKSKILSLLETIYAKSEINKNSRKSEIFSYLPKILHNEVLEKMYGKLLKNNPVFSYFSNEFLTNLLHEMEKEEYRPGQTICENGNGNNDNEGFKIYLIEQGIVDIYNGDKSMVLKELKQGQIFGEISFFSGNPNNYYAKTSTFTSLYSIKRENFIKLIKESSEDYEKFCQIKDDLNLYHSFEKICYKCNYCKGSNHDILHCPNCHVNVFYHRKNSARIQDIQTREQFLRKNKKNNALKNLHKIKLDTIKSIITEGSYNLESMSSDENSSSNLLIEEIENTMVNPTNSESFQCSLKEFDTYTQINPKIEKLIENIEKSVNSLGIEKKRASTKTKKSTKSLKEKTNKLSLSKNDVYIEPHLTNIDEEDEEKETKIVKKLYLKENTNFSKEGYENGINNKSMNSAIKLFSIDSLKEFKIYYPHNNFSNVMLSIGKESQQKKVDFSIFKKRVKHFKSEEIFQKTKIIKH